MIVWIFMLIDAIIFPITMIIFGLVFRKKAPKEINGLFGYRTTKSMKNKDTWDFAHHYIGNLWFILGLLLIIPSIVPMIFLIGKSDELIISIGLLISVIGIICIISSIFITEKALKKNFDEDGNRVI